MSRLSDAREVLELSVHIEPVHSVGALLNEAASDWEQDPAWFQDLFEELVIYTEV